MPAVDFFEGIKINIYHGDHKPPHIHAVYGDFEAKVKIEDYEVFAGHLPTKQFRKVIEWLKTNKKWAIKVFFELNPQLKK